MKMTFTGESTPFHGLYIDATKKLHPKAAKHLMQTFGFTITYADGGIICENERGFVVGPEQQAAGEAIQNEIDKEIAEVARKAAQKVAAELAAAAAAEAKRQRAPVITALNTYSKPFVPSFFGHHHQGRLCAVIEAIQKSSPTDAVKILSHQIALMTEATPSLETAANSNILQSDVLSFRWQTRLPGHRALSPAAQTKSGYVRALQQALIEAQAITVAAVAAPAPASGLTP